MGQLTPGNFSFPFNLDVQVEGPLDSRLTVATLSDLTSVPLKYPGMIVSVVNDNTNNGPYFLNDSGDWVAITTLNSQPSINTEKTLTSGSVSIDSVFDGYYDGQVVISGLGIDSLLEATLDATVFNSTDSGVFDIYMLGHDGGKINISNSNLYDSIFAEFDLSNQIVIGKGQYCKLWFASATNSVNYILHAI